MWIGRAVDSNFLQAVFGMGSFDQLDVLAAESVVGTRNDPLSETGRIKSSIQFSFSAIVGIDDDDDYDDDCDDSGNCPNFKTMAMKLTNQIFHIWRRDFQPRNPALFPVPLSNKRFGGRAWFLYWAFHGGSQWLVHNGKSYYPLVI
jgi:hypothetical protein